MAYTSETIKMPNAKQIVEKYYNKMSESYYLFEAEEDKVLRESRKVVYKTDLNNYRDVCTEVVERLLVENPKVLEDMHVLYLQ